MDEVWEAPAKVNLSLLVGAPDASGYHPIRSLVQTIDWLDRLELHSAVEDRLEVFGAELPTGAENLVWKGLEALDGPRPKLEMTLHKAIPVGAGLGGGSADAAAAIAAVAGVMSLVSSATAAAAQTAGADVPYFLTGGTALIEGYGERVSPLPALEGFAIAVVVPPFELATAEVYARWDSLGGPVGPGVRASALPPSLRSDAPLRNDLTPAAISIRPELGDWLSDLGSIWDRPAMMSGSGSAVFGFFGNLDEAAEASLVHSARAGSGVALRRIGVSRTDR